MRRVMAVSVLVGLLAIGFVPGAAAAATAVPGVSAHVTTPANPAFINVKWFVSSNDPDQDTGDWTYNITVDAGGGWVQVVTDGAVTDGVGAALLELSGAAADVSLNVTADDGTGPVDSCIVTVNTGTDLDYDACGTMEPDNTYQEFFCLETEGEDTGFTFVRALGAISGTTVINGDEILFKSSTSGSTDRLAVGALSLGGDIRELRLDTEFRFRADSLDGYMRLFFSTVNTPVGEISFGDGYTKGAFANGVGFEFREALNNVHVRVYRVTNGGVQDAYEEFNWITGTANDFNALEATFHPDSETITLAFGANEVTVTDNDPGTAFRSLWITEGWDTGLSGSVVTGGDGFCLSSSAENPVLPGTVQGQELPGFEGEGGVGGAPMFPGVNVNQTAEAVGLDDAVLAWILGAVVIGGLAILGFAGFRGVGGGVGATLGTVLSVVFNLIAFYWLVVIFLLAVSFIVFSVGRRE